DRPGAHAADADDADVRGPEALERGGAVQPPDAAEAKREVCLRPLHAPRFRQAPAERKGNSRRPGKAPRAFRAALTTPRAGGEVSAPMIHAVETFVVGLPLWGLLVAIAVALFALGKGADLVVEEAVTLATRMGV